MHSNTTIQNELIALNSVLADISNKNVYSVPDGYFAVLSHDILLAVREPVTDIEQGTVPAGYFDELAGNIMNKIKSVTNKEERTGLLDTVKDINVYRVPDGYFENLPAIILNKLPQPASVIQMSRRTAFFKYAVAAVITGLLGISIISLFSKKQYNQTLASTSTIMADATAIIKNNNFDAQLSTVSDDAIVKYLQESGEDVNAALVASVTDDNNLPNQEDYMLDENALDNLLSELKITESVNN